MTERSFVFTSESVSEGHPDKVCDQIADVVLDAALTADPRSRVACEVLCKEQHVVLAGEITTRATLDLPALVRDTVRRIGYVEPGESFHPDRLEILEFISAQAQEIARGVEREGSALAQGAGDQGIMFGYATDETPELMPLPILLAHRLTRTLAEHRRRGSVDWLRPDAKAQVSVLYRGGVPTEVATVLVSTQHASAVGVEGVRAFVRETVLPEALGRWHRPDLRLLVNPAGTFVQGGPSADAGVTGRKIIVDTYGGMARHGGGAFSGKDASKVDRSGAYFGRWVARQVVERGLARRAEIQVSYAIGEASPVSVHVETFGTGDPGLADSFVKEFDFRPGAIIERLGLLRPIYRATTNYGHFGRPGLPWEEPGS